MKRLDIVGFVLVLVGVVGLGAILISALSDVTAARVAHQRAWVAKCYADGGVVAQTAWTHVYVECFKDGKIINHEE